MQYQVQVKVGTSQEKVVVNPDGSLTVFLRAKPHDGEANAALIKILAKYFRVGKTQIIIERGLRSKNKVIRLVQE